MAWRKQSDLEKVCRRFSTDALIDLIWDVHVSLKNYGLPYKISREYKKNLKVYLKVLKDRVPRGVYNDFYKSLRKDLNGK